MTRRLVALVGGLCSLLALWGHPAYAQEENASRLQDARLQARADVAGPDGKGTDGPMRRIGYSLALLHRAHATPLPQAALRSVQTGLPIHNESVSITALAHPNRTAALRADLEALGLHAGASAGRLVSGRLPIAALRKAAQLPALHSAWPALSVTRIGATTSQGVAAMNTAPLRDRLGTQGESVQVGVLSNTYDNLDDGPRLPTDNVPRASDDVASGDLPGAGNPNGFTTPVRVLAEGRSPANDEGRALLQIVHDVAPAAHLSYHNATDGLATFVNGIRALADAGASVIADDVLFLAEPMFQDGLIAQMVDEVAFGNDVLYLSSAGNTGRDGYQSPFRASNQTGPAGGERHDFDPGPGVDGSQTITVAPPASGGPAPSISIALHWDQPAASAGGPGATSDLEIAILDKAGTVLALEQRANVGGNPFEFAQFTNDGSIDADRDGTPDSTFQISIERLSGPRPERIAYVAFTQNGPLTIDEWATGGPTLYGHPNARGAIAVGAAAYFNTPSFGPSSPRVNVFSARGGIPIVFDPRGQPLPIPEVRRKPDITAPDGGNTTFFGQLFDDNDSFPNFFGTSAAVAHAAGLAALVRSAAPSRTAEAVARALQESAIDVEQTSDGVPTGAGFDAFSGAGLVDGTAVTLGAPVVASFTTAATGPNTGTVQWTEGEAAIDTYMLERSFLGAPFETVATVDGGAGTYTISVDDLPVGTHVFRLRWTRTDGTEEMGPRRSLLLPATATVSLGDPYPNPTRGRLRLDVTVQREQGVLLGIYDVLGRLEGFVFSRVIRPDRPRIVEIPASRIDRLASGHYFIRAIGETFDEAVPFRVVR